MIDNILAGNKLSNFRIEDKKGRYKNVKFKDKAVFPFRGTDSMG
ncbi:hypothetical protein SAMN05421659_1034 [[Clostridium] fimetarium]|uniref:Uncharacterized protein n=1 Tax=[Clostridium] fimetarium TaxID=99656 RepID=A0A1I0ND85_9FIRM|nr:hypothetical protein SAMN05421659_1034 [[Clostridium] fimetarium]